MPPVVSALRAVVKMRSAPGAVHRLRIRFWKAPGTVRGETVDAHAFVIPVAVAQVAVVRMKPSDEQVLPAAAHGTLRGRHERQIAGDGIIGRDRALQRRRAGVLPAVTGGAAMRMLGPWLRDHDQSPARRRPSRTASSLGSSFIARWNAARASSF